MYTEYYINNIDEKDAEIKTNIDNCIKYSIGGVLAPFGQKNLFANFIPI